MHKEDELAVVEDELCVHLLAEENSKTSSSNVGTASSVYGGSAGPMRAYDNDVIVEETVIHVEDHFDESDEEVALDDEVTMNDDDGARDKQLLHRYSCIVTMHYK